MKRIITALLILLAFGVFYAKQNNSLLFKTSKWSIKLDKTVHPTHEIKDGDIIFQSSMTGQSAAIQLATNSKYSHCGIIFKEDGKHYVFEAVQPVTITPLDEWIARGDDKHYVIKRLIDAVQIITPEVLNNMKMECKKHLGKDYDLQFGWGDDEMYCSELVWKVYQRSTGIELGELKKLGDYHLNDPVVKKKLKERYGKSLPLEQLMIAPGAIFDSELLYSVVEEN